MKDSRGRVSFPCFITGLSGCVINKSICKLLNSGFIIVSGKHTKMCKPLRFNFYFRGGKKKCFLENRNMETVKSFQ